MLKNAVVKLFRAYSWTDEADTIHIDALQHYRPKNAQRWAAEQLVCLQIIWRKLYMQDRNELVFVHTSYKCNIKGKVHIISCQGLRCQS
jgi:hypothetical protein